MTLWLDAHLDPSLAAWLGATFGVIAKHIKELDLLEADDRALFEAARRFGEIVIITKDWDFVDLVQHRGKPPQIIRLAFGNLSTPMMQLRFSRSFPDALRLLEEGEDWVEIA